MGFFSDIGKKTSETTTKIAKETKLKIKINENKGKILDIYEEIGKKVYEKHVREENIKIKEDLNNECAKIDALSKEIEEARIEILKLNQKKVCKKCFAEIEDNSQFCPKCGDKQNNEQAIKEEMIEKLQDVEIEDENLNKVEVAEQKQTENSQE